MTFLSHRLEVGRVSWAEPYSPFGAKTTRTNRPRQLEVCTPLQASASFVDIRTRGVLERSTWTGVRTDSAGQLKRQCLGFKQATLTLLVSILADWHVGGARYVFIKRTSKLA